MSKTTTKARVAVTGSRRYHPLVTALNKLIEEGTPTERLRATKQLAAVLAQIDALERARRDKQAPQAQATTPVTPAKQPVIWDFDR